MKDFDKEEWSLNHDELAKVYTTLEFNHIGNLNQVSKLGRKQSWNLSGIQIFYLYIKHN
jgi:hypothetical protein